MERSSGRCHLLLSSLHNLQIFLHCHFGQGFSFITMTVWIRSLFLLVLLAISAPAISYTIPNQHLCGPQLVEALYFVCGDRGFYYSPKSRRNIEQPLVNGPSQNEVEPLPFQAQDFQKVKRGIVQQCCERICSLYELENYCN